MTTGFSALECSESLASPGSFRAEIIPSVVNRRLQVLSYDAEDAEGFVAALIERAQRQRFTKVFLKARATDAEALIAAGMIYEATIRGYHNGEDAAVLALFLEATRREQPALGEQDEILSAVGATSRRACAPSLPEGYRLSLAHSDDVAELAALYAKVFASYPYPIDDPGYLRETLESHVVYAIVRDGTERVVAAASGETVPALRNAEMTDFATLPDQRRRGLAQHLLTTLETEMGERGITNLYTIARARSFGMTKTFHACGYDLTGTLIQSCDIAGGFEDMHVWCKTLTR